MAVNKHHERMFTPDELDGLLNEKGADYYKSKYDEGKQESLIPFNVAREIMKQDDSESPWVKEIIMHGLGCAEVLIAVSEVLNHTQSTGKYELNSWMYVENAQQRYFDAWMRHEKLDGIDPDSGLPHWKHCVANLMFLVYFDIETRAI